MVVRCLFVVDLCLFVVALHLCGGLVPLYSHSFSFSSCLVSVCGHFASLCRHYVCLLAVLSLFVSLLGHFMSFFFFILHLFAVSVGRLNDFPTRNAVYW